MESSENCQQFVNNAEGFAIAGPGIDMQAARLVASFVYPQLCASIRARWNRQVEAVVLAYLAGIGAGTRANRGGNFGDPLVAVRINLLINKDEAFPARDVNPFAVSIIGHIVGVDRARQAGNFLACIHVQD